MRVFAFLFHMPRKSRCAVSRVLAVLKNVAGQKPAATKMNRKIEKKFDSQYIMNNSAYMMNGGLEGSLISGSNFDASGHCLKEALRNETALCLRGRLKG